MTTFGRTPRFSRRQALRLTGGVGLSGAMLGTRQTGTLASQTPAAAPTFEIPDTGADLPTEQVTFRWIDNGDQKAVFFNQFFPAYQEKHPNITIQYDTLPGPEMTKVVPLGIQNGDAHDVFMFAFGVPPAQAVAEGWVAPLDDYIPNFAEWKKGFPPGTLLPGITDFNGKTYVMLITSNRRYSTLLLYNAPYMREAGVDPQAKPLTWDEFRDAAKKITEQGQGQYYGLILEGKQPARWSDIVSNLARMAGRPAGEDHIDFATGEYVYTSDEYVGAIELLLAMNADGSIFPGSVSLNAAQARAQMPQGAAGMILQGPWNIPQWPKENPDFEFGVASQPVPNSGTPSPLTVPPGGSNAYGIYANSPYGAIAGDIFHFLGTLEGQRAWASLNPIADSPLFPEAAGAAEATPQASQASQLFAEQVRLGPSPLVRNPDAAQVVLELKPLSPDFGETVQGLFSGQLSDTKAAMRDLQDRADAELDRAIEAARANGAQVTRDDWVFANWDPTKDYSDEDYAALDG